MPLYEPQQSDIFEDIEDSSEPRRRCRHIFTAGRRCGSPCLRSEQFCYHHHTTRRPVEDPKARRARANLFTLPQPEDREAVRAAVAQIMHAIAANAIDLKRAGMLLYSLQIALSSLPPQPRPAPSKTADNSIPLNDIPEDIVIDETHGVIAPEAEYEPPPELKPRRTLAQQLLDEVERYEALQAAEVAAAQQAAAATQPAAAHPYATTHQPTATTHPTAAVQNTTAAPTENSVILSEVPRSASPRGTESKDPATAHTPTTARTFQPTNPHRPAAIDLRATADPSLFVIPEGNLRFRPLNIGRKRFISGCREVIYAGLPDRTIVSGSAVSGHAPAPGSVDRRGAVDLLRTQRRSARGA